MLAQPGSSHTTLLDELLMSPVPGSGVKHVLFWAKLQCDTFEYLLCRRSSQSTQSTPLPCAVT